MPLFGSCFLGLAQTPPWMQGERGDKEPQTESRKATISTAGSETHCLMLAY